MGVPFAFGNEVLTALSEDPVLMGPVFPIKGTIFLGPLDSSSEGLLDVDVFNASIVLVVLYVKGNRGEADGLSHKPAHALELENLVGRIAKVLVLQ